MTPTATSVMRGKSPPAPPSGLRAASCGKDNMRFRSTVFNIDGIRRPLHVCRLRRSL